MQGYSNPKRESDPYSLPDVEVWAWAILIYSRLVPVPKNIEPTRRYFAKIGIHITEGK